jgi:murein DD-endopeptidase MepM/ murein hydrolase activator NlpD
MITVRKSLLALAVAVAVVALAIAAPVHAAPATDTTYTVESGDTLSDIGDLCGVSWKEIAVYNRLANPDRIYPGQELSIPGDASCEVEVVAAPEQAAAEQEAAAAEDAAPAPVPVAAAVAAPAGFGYGVQIHAPSGDPKSMEMINGMGFNWVKQQVEWFRHEGSKGAYDFGGLDNLVNQANGAGINVMLSVCQPSQAFSGPASSAESVVSEKTAQSLMAWTRGASPGW